jgi:hypothetical protein
MYENAGPGGVEKYTKMLENVRKYSKMLKNRFKINVPKCSKILVLEAFLKVLCMEIPTKDRQTAANCGKLAASAAMCVRARASKR